MEKRQKYHLLIDSKIKTLISLQSVEEVADEVNEKISQTILDLETLVSTYGLSNNNTVNLIQLILDTDNTKIFKNSFKNGLIKCLYPINPVGNDVIIKIIGCIGINSKIKTKKQFIHKSLQLKLVRWLYLNIAINNVEGYSILQTLLPMIFNLVEVDHTMQWVSLIIFKVVIQLHTSKSFVKNFVKKWRLQVLIELSNILNYEDPYLLALIVLFENLLINCKLNDKLAISRLIRDKRIASRVFKYPSLKYLTNLINVKTMNGGSIALDNEFIENLAFSFQDFETYKHTFKKRKIDVDTEVTDLMNMISSLENCSLVELIDTYHELTRPAQLGLIIFKFANLSSHNIEIGELLEIKTIDTGIYQYLFSVRRLQLELNQWCEVALEDNSNEKLRNKIIKGITNMQMITGVVLPISYKLLTNDQLLRQLTLDDKLVAILRDFKWESENSISLMLRSLVEIFLKFPEQYQIMNQIYLIVLPQIPNILIQNRFSTSLLLDSLSFIKTMQLIPFQDLQISNLILSPGLCYFALLSQNSIIINEICKHISFTKIFFAEYYSTLIKDKDAERIEEINEFKNLHNSYVMEICNLLWRDKLFEKNVNSSSKSMLLPTIFITHLQNLTMIEENQIENFFKKSFSLFANPLFSNIVIKIIHDLEDENNCDIRYAGPIEEKIFNNFIKQCNIDNVKWLQVTKFEEFKLIILREMDKTEFNGITGLLFNSLKSLLNKR